LVIFKTPKKICKNSKKRISHHQKFVDFGEKPVIRLEEQENEKNRKK
jgi:hypothetical protein